MNAVVLVVSAVRARSGQYTDVAERRALLRPDHHAQFFLVLATLYIVTLGLARFSRRPGLRWLHRIVGPVSASAFGLTLLGAILAGLAPPLLIFSHVQHGGGWTSDLPRWSSLLGDRRAATLNTWSSVAFLALPVIAAVCALTSWAWNLISAAGLQLLSRGISPPPAVGFVVIAALAAGMALAAVGVMVYWRRRVKPGTTGPSGCWSPGVACCS